MESKQTILNFQGHFVRMKINYLINFHGQSIHVRLSQTQRKKKNAQTKKKLLTERSNC